MAQQNSRVRQQRIIIIFIVVALLLLVGGAFAIMGGGEKQKNAEPARPAGMVAVPVASQNINLGQRISSAFVTVKYMQPSEVPESAIIRADYVVGRYATKPIPVATYFKEDNISEPDVSGGYSAVAKPGKRVVVINANQLPGVIGTIRVGDHIDLLAIGATDRANAPAVDPQAAKDQRRVEYMLGGTQPGTPPGGRNNRNRAGNANTGNPAGLTATLISENAEVMSIPTRARDRDLVVLQMSPQDAHVTTLMVAAGASLRVVFRPSNDDETILAEREVAITTRMPKPEPDPDQVSIIVGSDRANTRADSARYATAEQNPSYGRKDPLTNQQFADKPAEPALEVIRREIQSNQYYE